MRYDTSHSSPTTKQEVEDFYLDNDLAAYFLGVSQDFKHFGFAVSVLILNEDGTKIVRLLRKEACYCRFAPADTVGKIPSVLYANWRKCVASPSDIEVIDLLDPSAPWRDLQDKLAPFLDLAEAWVRNTFTSEPTYNTICGYTDSNPIRIATARLVVADALRRAIPSLDVVFTPNGFATVGTQNLVAASKMRVDRLVGSMLTHRDDCIAALLSCPNCRARASGSTPTKPHFSAQPYFPLLRL